MTLSNLLTRSHLTLLIEVKTGTKRRHPSPSKRCNEVFVGWKHVDKRLNVKMERIEWFKEVSTHQLSGILSTIL